jgi:hypothetical protein
MGKVKIYWVKYLNRRWRIVEQTVDEDAVFRALNEADEQNLRLLGGIFNK